ncbi:hypothetical protein HANVADRAFT_3695 [Hanseniaspora valbyensis NRRL Y-1626]|uniref:Uncharacterized protein n=1 Tax=Hanseniaspora valbyensis NRRL Y-1626 TaxID=766949 RepID=A0A1B7T9T2_9ASCO|nr:hypothetical protein HANVADRAFT_3695 [Hanseniaspora valbyensis NRRL Y-1626]
MYKWSFLNNKKSKTNQEIKKLVKCLLNNKFEDTNSISYLYILSKKINSSYSNALFVVNYSHQKIMPYWEQNDIKSVQKKINLIITITYIVLHEDDENNQRLKLLIYLYFYEELIKLQKLQHSAYFMERLDYLICLLIDDYFIKNAKNGIETYRHDLTHDCIFKNRKQLINSNTLLKDNRHLDKMQKKTYTIISPPS